MTEGPPYSEQAEKSVLGCIFWDAGCLDECESIIADGAFYDLRHDAIYKAQKHLRELGRPVEIATVQEVLRDRGLLEKCGGIIGLSEIHDGTASAASLPHWLEIVVNKWTARRLLKTAGMISDRAQSANGDIGDVLDVAEREILSVRLTRARENNIADISRKLFSRYEAAFDGKAPSGLMSGFDMLDRKAGGMMGQEMIVIGGVPSSGKTTLALNIAWNCANAGTTVSIASLETSAEKIVHRFNCLAGKVDGGGFMRGEPLERDVPKMTLGLSRVKAVSSRLMIHDHSMTAGQWSAQCRKDYQRGARLFILDMLQLLEAKGDSDFQQVSNASKCIKRTAKELDCPVIVMSSLSRAEKGKPRKPTMHDLRQSGQIESDADKIYLLWCGDTKAPIRDVELDIAKNKDGEQATLNFVLFASQFRFESASPVSDEDVPHNHNE